MKLVINGKEVEASAVTFSQGGEMTQSLLLDDGTVLKVRVIVTEVFRFEGVADTFGRQTYGLNHATIVTPAPSEGR